MAEESEREGGLLTYIGQAWLVLVLAVCFGTALAAVEKFTRPKIERNIKDFIAARLVEMFGKGTTTTEPVELDVTVDGRERTVPVYPAIRGGRRVGWGIQAEGRGYDTLLMVIGVDESVETLVGYRVVTSLETEGIGDVIELQPGKPASVAFVEQFAGRDASRPLEPVAPDKPATGNRVHTVSGATISSKGVVATINANLAAVREKLRAMSKEAGGDG